MYLTFLYLTLTAVKDTVKATTGGGGGAAEAEPVDDWADMAEMDGAAEEVTCSLFSSPSFLFLHLSS